MSVITPELISFAHDLIDAGGGVIRRYFRQTNVGVEAKEDATLVTLADRGAEEVIRKMIESQRPDDGIWGEEFGEKKSKNGWQWVLDPVDGTVAFASGSLSFGSILGLTYDDEPLLGIVDQPVTNERWFGIMGQGSWFNSRPIRTSTKTELKDSIFGCTHTMRHNVQKLAAHDRLYTACRTVVMGGNAYGYALLANGYLEVIAEPDLKLHDYCGLIPIIEAAGGVITDWQGNSLHGKPQSDVLASANPTIHEAAMKILNA